MKPEKKYENPSSAKTKIIKQLGYFPAFLIPAIDSCVIYRSLVEQTLFAYVNNPLPPVFKEKLFVVLSRYYGLEYFTICHSCTLNDLGVSSAGILALDAIEYPRQEERLQDELTNLAQQDTSSIAWLQEQKPEANLLRCSSLIFIYPELTTELTTALKSILGNVWYHYLIILLGYIKLCHQWLRGNPHISHQKDRRSQLHLGSMLLSESRLVQFFQTHLQGQNNPVASLGEPGQLNSVSVSGASESQKFAQNNFANCLANAPFPVMVHTQSGRVVYLNQSWIETTGYDATEIPTLSQWNQKAQVQQSEIVRLPGGRSTRAASTRYVSQAHQTKMALTRDLKQLLAPLIDDSLGASSQGQSVGALPDAIKSEVAIHTRAGKQLFWELYSTVVASSGGENELTVAIAKDVTGIVLDDHRIAELEAKLRLVFEATRTGSWSWNLVTNQVDICHRGRLILGLDNFDGTYEGFLQAIHPDERESIDLDAAKAIQSRQDLELEFRILKVNRELARVRAQGKLDFNVAGRAIRISGVISDITPKNNIIPQQDEQEAAGSQTAESRFSTLSELETVINLLPYYLLVVDVKTQEITLLNAELAGKLNLDATLVIGQTIDQCFAAEYVDQIAWQHQQVVTHKRLLRVQEEVVFPDGVHYLDTVVTPLVDKQGEIYALLRTSSDIPDLAATQEVLSKRTLQLEAANKELESFSYSVSHDLQAPLRIINGFSQVLWDNYRPNLDDRGRHYLQRIQANSKRMSDLIDALLQLSRVTRSQMKSTRVNLSAIAWDVIDEIRGENPERLAEFEVAEGVEITGDASLMRIVLSNLLNNAWKYTSKCPATKIEFGVIEEGASQITYYVRDNGVGFDQMYADKLFTAFQRLHSQSEFPGTGIGLATVQRIIFRHGGKVWAEGEYEQGATIYFSL